jgi:hypothetical protein
MKKEKDENGRKGFMTEQNYENEAEEEWKNGKEDKGTRSGRKEIMIKKKSM